jgi:arabinan endo-1,5-alpha-L-arabinosidase
MRVARVLGMLGRKTVRLAVLGLSLLVVNACGNGAKTSADGGATADGAASLDANTAASDAGNDAPSCTTRIEYGAAWIRPTSHADDFDIASGQITWDGACTDDGANSYATLSNGWRPYFSGHSACVLALDEAACGTEAQCATRVTYGSGWIAPQNHPAAYDDVVGRVFSDAICHGGVYADLSNGWQPHFANGTCPLSLRYTQCNGLYTNPIIAGDCPDPGVLRDGSTYVLTCTSGNAANAFPIYTSSDLAHWTLVSHVFPANQHPLWATGDFWAPEIHKVGAAYVAYFSARSSDGKLSIGAASATSPTGPFTDIGAPLIHDPNMGLIDASEITTSSNAPYVLWKEDGNAVGKPTPIHSQLLAPDGLSLTGARATLITNDQGWEGTVVEGPFMVEHGGTFYLFYSGNSYANATYAVGVARGSSPASAMTKLGTPILVSTSAWIGPGHCSVLDTPAGNTVIVNHAWTAGCVNQAGCGRATLLDSIAWGTDGWPSTLLAPSSTTRPIP